MHSNKYLPLVFGFVLALLLGLTSCQQLSETKSIFLAHSLPTSHPVHKGIEYFQQELLRISNNKLAIKIFPDGQLGSEREMLELLQIGSIAMTKVSAAPMANFVPEFEVLGVPYLFRDSEHQFRVLEGEIGKSLLEKGGDYLLRGLCFYDAGARSFYTKNKPIEQPIDLEGLKIRVQNHQMSLDMVNALGGSATPMAFGELYTSLQQGVVDGAENNPPSFVTSNHYEICKYYSLDEHSYIPDVLIVSTKFWDTLTDQEKSWLQEAAAASVEAQKKYWAESVQECFELLEEAGVTIIRPDKTQFAAEAKAILDEFSKDPKMKALVDEIQAL